MFARMYLNLLVCGFKIKTCAHERSMRVFWHESEAHVGCHWQADAFWDIALGVHPAHCAVQDQAWFPWIKRADTVLGSASAAFQLPMRSVSS